MGFEDNIGKIVRLTGWVVLVVMATLWLLLPLARGLMNITTKEEALFVFREVIWGIDGEELLKMVIGFVGACVIIRIGGYMREHELQKKSETEDRIVGYLKLSGRTDIENLAQKVGMPAADIMKTLSLIRQKRDIVFLIEDNEVYMPGYERERPKEVIREIVKEVVKIPCNHCGSLVDLNAEKCPNCAAPIKA
jgi:hypothetical protein